MDDLPRSRTGRVPQWVRDDAAGRSTVPPGWRTLAPAPGLARQSRRVGKRGRLSAPAGTLLLVVLVGAAALGGAVFADGRTVDELRAGVERLVSPGATAPAQPAEAFVAAETTGPAPVEAVMPSTPAVHLPPTTERNYPKPGFEEAPAPLGVPPTPTAAEGPYSFNAEQTRSSGSRLAVAWSPCRPIRYVTDLTGAPEGFTTQLQAVLAEVSTATGLRFVDDGLTVEAADIDRAPFLPALYGDRWAPVLIRFADETDVAFLAGDVVGVATPTHATDPTTGRTHLVTGAVYLDDEILDDQPATGAGPAHVEVLRHEVGHLVGLGHVRDPSQAMHPSTSGVTAFQPGDLTGLAILGRGPCAPGL